MTAAKRRIGVVSTRLSGTDGVSLETSKWVQVLQRMGHEVMSCAGELDEFYEGLPGSIVVPEMSFFHPAVARIHDRCFEREPAAGDKRKIRRIARLIQEDLQTWVETNQIDLLLVENALAIPMNIPLGLALSALIEDTHIDTIAHHHDFYWERDRYRNGYMQEILEKEFPPDLENMVHVTINSIAAHSLKRRRGIFSTVIPNVFDFSTRPPSPDGYNGDIRNNLGIGMDDLMVLQPTRVVRRKGIELAVELLSCMDLDHPRLFLSHSANDEGNSYWEWLQREAVVLGVDLEMIDSMISTRRSSKGAGKTYTLWDIYPYADLVTYPSLYEGFGNALLEAVYFKRPVVVNRYPVYNADIRPLGFQGVELEGYIDDKAVDRVHQVLQDDGLKNDMVEANFAIGQQYFSLEALQTRLAEVLSQF